MKIVINRPKWRCGGSNNSSRGCTRLLNEQGYMCCLGFASKQICNLSDEEMLTKHFPQSLHRKINKLTYFPRKGICKDTKFSEKAMGINDNPTLSNKEREKQLKELFAKNGIELKFTGKYA